MRWRSCLTDLGTWTSRPAAFAIVAPYVICWLIFSPETLEWHGLATLITWMTTLFIERAEHRDTQAIHAKLDERLHVHGNAENEITQIDEKEPEQIEQFCASQTERSNGWGTGTFGSGTKFYPIYVFTDGYRVKGGLT
jgi:low affinity Fe/Cu permease